jgi:hypothetical protein
MKYTLQEGSFSLFAAPWQDSTMNILRDEESGLSLVITRGTISEKGDLEQEFHRQWDLLRPQMGKITQSEFMRVLVGVDFGLKAIEVETAFERNGQNLWQRQLAVQLPDKPQLLLFTLSAQRPFSEEDGQRWSAFKHTLVLE